MEQGLPMSGGRLDAIRWNSFHKLLGASVNQNQNEVALDSVAGFLVLFLTSWIDNLKKVDSIGLDSSYIRHVSPRFAWFFPWTVRAKSSNDSHQSESISRSLGATRPRGVPGMPGMFRSVQRFVHGLVATTATIARTHGRMMSNDVE